MSLPDPYPAQPFTKPVRGAISVPGSKSITNRALILSALHKGPVTLEGALFSRDTQLMCDALCILGVSVETDEARKRIHITGTGGDIPNAEATLHVGNAGTVARFLTAFLCLRKGGRYTVKGDEAMTRRPMQGLTDALSEMGARFIFHQTPGHIPFTVETQGLRGGRYTIDATASSQILSAFMMVAHFADGPLELEAPGVRPAFVELTQKVIDAFKETGLSTYAVEPDLTAASYFLALPTATGGSATVLDLPPEPMQGDARFAEVLTLIGQRIQRMGTGWISRSENSEEEPLEVDFSTFSDTFLTLAALTPLLPFPVTIAGIGHTRKQETDRVAGMARELRKLGQEVEEGEDYLRLQGNREAMRDVALKGPIEIETYEDHRFAMSFAILGCHDLLGTGEPWLRIKDPLCCRKTFPDFFDVLEQLCKDSHFPVIAIDGGAASGKSSTARGVAARMHFLFVSTGLHYRALTHVLLEQGVSVEQPDEVEAALCQLSMTSRIKEGESYLLLNGERIPEETLTSSRINENVSAFAAIPQVRTALKAYQQSQAKLAQETGFAGLIMEGRDIGTVVFPDADLKIYLTADRAEREARRQAEGISDSIASRDEQDSSRKAAPLQAAQDAWIIDNSTITLDEVVEMICSRLQDGKTQS